MRSLDVLQRDYKEWGSINERQEMRVNLLEARAITLTIAYAIFQAIILTSIEDATTLECQHRWIFFTVSLMVTLIYGLTFMNTVVMYSKMRYQLDLNRIDQESIAKEMCISEPPDMEIGRASASGVRQVIIKPDEVEWFKFKVYILVVLLALAAFSGAILYACCSIACV